MSSAAFGVTALQERWWRDPESKAWPLLAIALLILVQFTSIFTRAVNWDEFFFFHQVAAFRQGELDSALQTLNTRLFYWLPGLFETSVDHVLAARIVMLTCEAATLVAIYKLARHFTGATSALIAALLYISAGYVRQHGFSFRVDPMVTAALMWALVVFARSRLDIKSIAVFGLLAAIGAMITIKTILYLPAFAGIALMRLHDDGWQRTVWFRLLACAIAALILFALLYAWHSTAVTTHANAAEHSGWLLGESIRWIFFLGIPPYWHMGVKAALLAPIFTLAIIATPVLIWRSERTLGQKMALTGLWLPVLTPFYYTNTAAYFYVYMLAPLAVSSLVAIDWAQSRFQPLLMVSALTSIAIGVFLMDDRGVIDRQRQLERNVYEIFPQPVRYFDHNYMLGDWPKANLFMTSWGMNRYRLAGENTYREAMERDTVPLLLANWWILRAVMNDGGDTLLLPADTAAMRGNYIEFAPFIYVAGKHLEAGTERTEEFLVPGPYTVSGGAVTIDGRTLQPDDVIDISRGIHQVVVPTGADVTLTWGDHLQQPSKPLSPGPLYVSF